MAYQVIIFSFFDSHIHPTKPLYSAQGVHSLSAKEILSRSEEGEKLIGFTLCKQVAFLSLERAKSAASILQEDFREFNHLETDEVPIVGVGITSCDTLRTALSILDSEGRWVR
jgi:hypothetical protein